MRVVDCEYDNESSPVSVTCEDDGEYYTFYSRESNRRASDGDHLRNTNRPCDCDGCVHDIE